MMTHINLLNEEFFMPSQLDFFSPHPQIITSDSMYTELKYPGEINNSHSLKNTPGHKVQLSVQLEHPKKQNYVDGYFLSKGRFWCSLHHAVKHMS